jgi:hypothetical protein
MARPVRPGTGTTHRTSEASQPGMQNGTLFADPIRASSPKSTASTGRTEDCSRPTPIRQISLAMREPSTEDAWSYSVLNLARAQGGAPLCRTRRSLGRIFIDWIAAGCRRLCPPLHAFRWAINLPYGILRCIRSSTANRLAVRRAIPAVDPAAHQALAVTPRSR